MRAWLRDNWTLGILLAGLIWAVSVTIASATDPSVLLGVPMPSAQPTCATGAAGVYADPNGCVYSCASGQQTILARSRSALCVFPTSTGATATPTPTVTATP